jgi:cytoskeletal protein RodZ
MTGSTPRPDPAAPAPSGLRWNWWNLLLLLPLLMLVTPWFNSDQPRVLGMPVFYWSQFLWVVVGVLSVLVVYLMTRDRDTTTPVPEPEPGVDTLDEATVADAPAAATTTATSTTAVADKTDTPTTTDDTVPAAKAETTDEEAAR